MEVATWAGLTVLLQYFLLKAKTYLEGQKLVCYLGVVLHPN